jgi:DNA-binding IclR family transcriptional regulator
MRKAKSPAPALERGLELLRILAAARGGSTALELERALAIPRSSLYRILRIFMNYGFITQDRDDGRFYLSVESMALGFSAHAAHPLTDQIRFVLREVVRATGQMCEFAVPTGRWNLLMLETWQSERTPINAVSRSGMYFFLNHANGHGLCFLTFDGKRRFDDYLARTPDGNGVPVPPADLQENCLRWRKLGYAFDPKPNTRNTRRIAAPVFDPRSNPPRLLGSLGVVCDAAELSSFRIAKWGKILVEGARKLERAFAK